MDKVFLKAPAGESNQKKMNKLDGYEGNWKGMFREIGIAASNARVEFMTCAMMFGGSKSKIRP